ncbi:MAG: HlyC/CorC family transporter [Anaerolineae bacterium]|nr:HlyC/CorC family transporter [Anaerolineae bacterium]
MLSRGLLDFVLLFVLVLINGVFAMAEIAVVSARKARLEARADRGDIRAGQALKLAEAPNAFLSTVQIGITLIGILAGAFGGATLAEEIALNIETIPILGRYAEALAVGLVVIVTTYLSLVLGELVPKRIGLSHPEAIASVMARPMGLLLRITAPIVRLLTLSTELVLKVVPVDVSQEEPVTEEEIAILIEDGVQSGVFEQAEYDIIERVFRLDRRPAARVMIPRTEVVWLNAQDARSENETKMASSGFSYFPLCDGGIDRILGIISAKDVWTDSLEGGATDLKDLVRPTVFVPKAASTLRLLEMFQQARQQVAIVIGEHGGVEGFITLKDVLEALVGELPDEEGQPGEPTMIERQDGTWLVDGLLPLDEFKAYLDIEVMFPGEVQGHFQTVGGYVMTRLDRVPSEADSFQDEHFLYEVVDMDHMRVDKVLVRPLKQG